MFNKIFTILKIKRLKQEQVNDLFLGQARKELTSYMAQNPVMHLADDRLSKQEKISKFTYFNKLNFKHMPAVIIALIALISGGGVAAASQSSLPNQALYPVKILTEEVREVFTPDSVAKAKLHAQYAAKRVEEVQKMLDAKEVDAKGLAVAMANLKEHAAQAANIIDQARSQGKDVKDLAKEIQTKIEKAKVDLGNELDQAGAKADNNDDRKLFQAAADQTKQEIEDSEDKIGKSEEFKQEAQAAILDAQAQLETASSTALASSTELIKYGEFMDKASTAISKEHWVQARQHAEQAIKFLDKAENKSEGKDENNKPEDGAQNIDNAAGDKNEKINNRENNQDQATSSKIIKEEEEDLIGEVEQRGQEQKNERAR